jgi:hypothetical protein
MIDMAAGYQQLPHTDVGLAALCIGGGQTVSLTIKPHHRECAVENEAMSCHSIHVVEGRYNQARIAKVSGAVQSA